MRKWHSTRSTSVFSNYVRTITAPHALAEAQAILIQSGAISYSADQLLRRAVKAQTILTEMTLSDPVRITILFDQLVAPVQALFSTIGVTQPNSLIASIPRQLALAG
ncbi:MAG: hypothetical protein NT075_09945 [Chloroflexi bacterium]|nr:hypothetical protein [Chloroflexota bacterium]